MEKENLKETYKPMGRVTSFVILEEADTIPKEMWEAAEKMIKEGTFIALPGCPTEATK